MLVAGGPGINRATASVLTAVSLQAKTLIDATNPPSIDDIQVINSLNLITP